jgi:hypothetical protein
MLKGTLGIVADSRIPLGEIPSFAVEKTVLARRWISTWYAGDWPAAASSLFLLSPGAAKVARREDWRAYWGELLGWVRSPRLECLVEAVRLTSLRLGLFGRKVGCSLLSTVRDEFILFWRVSGTLIPKFLFTINSSPFGIEFTPNIVLNVALCRAGYSHSLEESRGS